MGDRCDQAIGSPFERLSVSSSFIVGPLKRKSRPRTADSICGFPSVVALGYRDWGSVAGCIRSSPIVVPITSPDTTNSTRRFCCRPAAVSLDAIG